MMAAFYIGCGVSLAGVAASPNLVMLAVSMFGVGVFAAIYHPVGMPMLLEASRAQGRTVAFNGVCGNMGVALAAGVTAAIASWLGWRAAFLVPAFVCVATGIGYVMLVPDDRHHTAKRKTVADVVLPQRTAMTMFGLYVVISLAGGLTFNTISIALPKIVDERLGADVSLAAGRLARHRGVLVRGGGADRGRPAGRIFQALSAVRHHRRAAIRRHPVGGQRHRPDAAARARGLDGRDLRAGDGRRPGDRALHGGRLARPRLCGALFPHVRVGGRGGVDHRLALRAKAASTCCWRWSPPSPACSWSACWASCSWCPASSAPDGRRSRRNKFQNSGGIRSSTFTRMCFLTLRHDAAAVAGLRIAAVAQQRDALARLDQRQQFIERVLRLARLDVLVVDAPERGEVAGTRGGAACRRRSQFLQMDVGNAGVIERRRELALGETRPARGRHRAGVDQKIDLGALELGEHRGGLCLLVANRQQSLHSAVTRMTHSPAI